MCSNVGTHDIPFSITVLGHVIAVTWASHVEVLVALLLCWIPGGEVAQRQIFSTFLLLLLLLFPSAIITSFTLDIFHLLRSSEHVRKLTVQNDISPSVLSLILTCDPLLGCRLTCNHVTILEALMSESSYVKPQNFQ